MSGDELGHLKHVHDVLATEDLFQLVIGLDIAFVGRILEVIGLNVLPQLFHDF